MTGHGGWPLTAFCDPEGVPFYGGTYFPPEPRHGMPSFRMVMEAVVESWADPARADPRVGGAHPHPARRRRPDRALDRAALRRDRRRRGRAAALGGRHAQRRLRRGAEVPARVGARAAAHPRPDRRGGGDARRDGRGRDQRSDRRRIRPLLGRRRLAGPPLREDALRQRAARRALPARLRGPRARALAPDLRADARLDADRDARPRGRLLLGARRRLGGRGGTLLRLDPGRDPRGARRGRPRRGRGRGDRPLRGHGAGQLRGSQHPPPARRRAPSRRRGSTRRGEPCTRRGRSGCGPASTTSACCPGTRSRSAPWPMPGRCSGATDYLDAARACAGVRLGADARRRAAACCAPGRTARRSSTPTSRTTPTWSRRC